MTQTRMLMPTRRHADMQTHEHADMPTCRCANAPAHEHADTQRVNNAPTVGRADTPTRQCTITPARNHPNASARPLTHTCPRVHPTPPMRRCAAAQCIRAGTLHRPVVWHAHTRVLMCSGYPHRHNLLYLHSSSLFGNIMYFCI